MDYSQLIGGRYVEALVAKLGLPEVEIKSFVEALLKGNAGRGAVVLTPNTPKGWVPPFAESKEAWPWLPEGVFPVSGEEKSGRQEGYAEGWFYPLDLSSVWEGSALAAWHSPVRRFLDLCAAPGGKSMLCAYQLHPKEHLANEVDAGRIGILYGNLRRCGYTDSVYTKRMMPKLWGDLAPESFDGIWVDAPCSGQSLLAKGIKNPGCFHPSAVKGNAKRQKGVLSGALACLAPGGFLGYSTCSFSLEENELMVAWVLKKFPEMETVQVLHLTPWQSSVSPYHCYRLMPQHGVGAGGFVTLFRKKGKMPEILPELGTDFYQFPVTE